MFSAFSHYDSTLESHARLTSSVLHYILAACRVALCDSTKPLRTGRDPRKSRFYVGETVKVYLEGRIHDGVELQHCISSGRVGGSSTGVVKSFPSRCLVGAFAAD